MSKKKKDPHAMALGRKGGKARVLTTTAAQRREIGRQAIEARWRKHRQQQEDQP